MAELITVRGNHDGGGVALNEKNEAHPSGEAFVIGNMVAQVARTPEVEQRLWSGLLVEVKPDEPLTEPFEGYGKLSATALATKLAAVDDKGRPLMSDNERLLVRQYEASTKNRKQVVVVEDAPVASKDK
jgi:hypothetical protein